MLRALVALLFLNTPALAWDVEPGVICKLVRDSGDASVLITFDPRIPEYAISITSERVWGEGPVFAMQFDGPRGNIISTERHVVSGDGATLTVTDRGFGNVLNGLEFNDTATALLGDQSVAFSLDGAESAVPEFRACAAGLSS